MIHAIIKSTFAGVHSWPDAPDEQWFLRNEHRHLFTVLVKVDQLHADRQVEFFAFAVRLNEWIEARWPKRSGLSLLGSLSCEMIAGAIMTDFPEAIEVTVFEDGENGGGVTL